MLTYLSMFLQLSEPSGIVEGSNGNALFASIYFIIFKMFSYYIDLDEFKRGSHTYNTCVRHTHVDHVCVVCVDTYKHSHMQAHIIGSQIDTSRCVCAPAQEAYQMRAPYYYNFSFTVNIIMTHLLEYKKIS